MMHVNGKMIGRMENFPTCIDHPLVPYAWEEDYAPYRPTPWEMGQEYDGAPLNSHFPNVAVKPSNWFHGTFDDLHVWNASLTQAELGEVAQGKMPRPSEQNVRFSFDLDDPTGCAERQLWDKTLECHGINEEKGRFSPKHPFAWTNSLSGNVPHVPSPFWQLPGSTVHRTMQAGTVGKMTLVASDANGDAVTFKLPTGTMSQVSLTGSELSFDDTAVSGKKEVQIKFDVCDTFGLCASTASGLGTAIFHLLPQGPKITAFQALRDQGALRIIFNDLRLGHVGQNRFSVTIG